MNEQWLDLIFTIVKTIVGVSGSIAIYYIGKYFKTTQNEKEFNSINEFIKSAVVAAEYIYKNKAKSGELKFQYVLEVVKKKGIDIDPNTLNALINDAIVNSVIPNEAFDKKQPKPIINEETTPKKEEESKKKSSDEIEIPKDPTVKQE